MTLVKFRRKPFGNLATQDFFDIEDFLQNRRWIRNMLPTDFWNEKTSEPALNIRETDDNFEIEISAPGFGKKDFDATIDDGCLKISGEKTGRVEEKDENFIRKEFSYKSFIRSLRLPESIKEEEIKAQYKDGILSFKLTKKEEVKKRPPKVIEIV
jgi:HSP20 family protein